MEIALYHTLPPQTIDFSPLYTCTDRTANGAGPMGGLRYSGWRAPAIRAPGSPGFTQDAKVNEIDFAVYV